MEKIKQGKMLREKVDGARGWKDMSVLERIPGVVPVAGLLHEFGKVALCKKNSRNIGTSLLKDETFVPYMTYQAVCLAASGVATAYCLMS